MLHPWNYSGYNPNKEWYDYNPEKAKELLKEAGYENDFKMELIATDGRYPGDKAACEALLIRETRGTVPFLLMTIVYHKLLRGEIDTWSPQVFLPFRKGSSVLF